MRAEEWIFFHGSLLLFFLIFTDAGFCPLCWAPFLGPSSSCEPRRIFSRINIILFRLPIYYNAKRNSNVWSKNISEKPSLQNRCIIL